MRNLSPVHARAHRALRALSALVILGGSVAHAADPGIATADTLALGGASAADTHASAALLSNPATLALERRYDLFFGARMGAVDDWWFQTEARDSRSGPVALGLAYTRRSASPPPDLDDMPGWQIEGEDVENPLTESTIALGASTALLNRRLALGLSGVRYSRDTALTERATSWDMGFGVASHPVEGLDISVGLTNLLGAARGGDEEHPLTLSGGVGLHFDERARLLGAVDANLGAPEDGVPLGWAVGGELTVAKDALPLRVGFSRDAALDTHFLSAGFGLQATSASLDYGLRVDLGEGGGASAVTGTRMWHAITLRVVLPDDGA